MRRILLPLLRALPAAALLLCNSCRDLAGGSGETGNPELVLAMDLPQSASGFTGTLRLFSADHDPLADSTPLLSQTLTHARTARISRDELVAAFQSSTLRLAGFGDSLKFNCVFSILKYETFLGGFILTRGPFSSSLIRVSAGVTVKEDRQGTLRVSAGMENALIGMYGQMEGGELDEEMEGIFMRGTPYHAPVSEGRFRLGRIVPGDYALWAKTIRHERFAAAQSLFIPIGPEPPRPGPRSS